VSLELGGKNPAIVMKDADIDSAVKGVVRSGFLNSGQICLCGSRVLVHADIYDEFLAKMKVEVESLK
ncbi:ALDH8A1, partial [Symbiodinium microadriaticum]